MWADMIDDDAAGDGGLARGCEGSVKKKVEWSFKKEKDDDDGDDDNAGDDNGGLAWG